MPFRFSHFLFAAAAAVLHVPGARAEGDAAAGQRLYVQRCAACHSVHHDGAGPTHENLFGRRAGTVPGFPYSAALKASSVVWDEDTLSRWLADPEKFIPGQRMSLSVPDARERADIVAYLRLATGPQASSPRTPGAKP